MQGLGGGRGGAQGGERRAPTPSPAPPPPPPPAPPPPPPPPPAPQHARVDGLDVFGRDRVGRVGRAGAPLLLQGDQGLQGQGRAHRVRPVPQQAAKVVHLPGFGAVDDEADARPLLQADEVGVHRAQHGQGGHGHPLRPGRPVGQDDEGGAVVHGGRRGLAGGLDGGLHAVLALGRGPRRVHQRAGPPLEAAQVDERLQLGPGQHGLAQLQAAGGGLVAGGGDVALGPHHAARRRHHALAHRVQGRVGDLRCWRGVGG